MDFFFPADDLERLSPERTRIESVEAVAYPDGERVRVNLRITPFLVRPYIEIAVHDAQGHEVAAASIVEPMSWNLELTLHLRGASGGPFTLGARLYYPEGPQCEPVTADFATAAS